ncbi:hypothetical protein [Ornithinimicrobium cavernae]|uniref:hypothetical protein n=1 Tax=Ornithinimicrobium cavernae TaxID=2666047 RepID=UPI000D68B420|nr:hypothetical protein [Ornithinimicrobium cavernae]
MKSALRSALAAVAAAALTVSLVPSAMAENIGHEGCTPGYWKNHTDNWEETSPSMTVGNLYSAAPASVSGSTLASALNGGGGPGVDGAASILARASVASWLNAAHEGLGFPWRRYEAGLDGRTALVAAVNAAFASSDRATMLALADTLDADNNLGCPLN